MDITLLTKNSMRIKGKQAALVINPDRTLRAKVQADAVLALEKNSTLTTEKIEEHRLSINSNGEYEIGGIKMTVTGNGQSLFYDMVVDDIHVMLASTNTLTTIKETLDVYQVCILHANANIDQAVLSALDARVIVVFGEKADDVMKSLGKSSQKVTKYSITAEKLPAETEVVLLE